MAGWETGVDPREADEGRWYRWTEESPDEEEAARGYAAATTVIGERCDGYVKRRFRVSVRVSSVEADDEREKPQMNFS